MHEVLVITGDNDIEIINQMKNNGRCIFETCEISIWTPGNQ